MAKKRSDKLTDGQQALLRTLSETEWTLPGRLQQQSFDKFERLGLVEGDLMFSKSNARLGTAEFRRAYRLTKHGKAVIDGGVT